MVVCLATLSLFSVYTSKAKVAFLEGWPFPSQPELFEIALIGWKKTKPPKNLLWFRTSQM